MTKIRVLLADRCPIFLDGIKSLLTSSHFECIGEATDGDNLLSLTRELVPDIVILDAYLPKLNGIESIVSIKKTNPETKVLILSDEVSESLVVSSVKAGAAACLSRNITGKELINTLDSIHAGEGVFNLKTFQGILDHLIKSDGVKEETKEQIYPRELQVLKMVSKGMHNRQIAKELLLSERTVQNHLFNLFRKIKVKSRTEAVLYALNHGLIKGDELSGK